MVGRCLWDQPTEGKCRSGHVIGLTSSTLKGPRNILQQRSKFTRKMAKSSLGGEVHALSEIADHMLLLKDYHGPIEGGNPGVAVFHTLLDKKNGRRE